MVYLSIKRFPYRIIVCRSLKFRRRCVQSPIVNFSLSPIYEGLKESNFKEDHIFVVNSLDEATKIIGNLAKPKDVVLFENDLPDTYTE